MDPKVVDPGWDDPHADDRPMDGPLHAAADEPRTEQIVRLLSAHHERLYHYIFSLLPHEEDAKDVVQETCLALCRKFDAYRPDQPFLPWAYKFAYLEVLKHRERGSRRARMFREEVLALLAREREPYEELLERRLTALEHCLEALPGDDRRLIGQRYRREANVDELAAQMGSSRRTLFRNLERVRRLLFDCITRRAAAEGWA